MAQIGGAVMAKWVIVFLGDMLKKALVFRGVPFPVIAWPRTGFGPFELPTCGLLQKGWDKQAPVVYLASRRRSGEAKH